MIKPGTLFEVTCEQLVCFKIKDTENPSDAKQIPKGAILLFLGELYFPQWDVHSIKFLAPNGTRIELPCTLGSLQSLIGWDRLKKLSFD